MKRVFALALATVMAACLLAACGGSSSSAPAASAPAGSSTAAPAGDATVQLDFSWWGNQTRNDRTQSACELYTQQHPNVTFNLMPINNKEYFDKLSTLVAGNEAPAIMQQDYGRIKKMIDKGVHEDMTPYVDSGVIDLTDIPEAYLSSGFIDGKYYAFSMGVNAPCMVYDEKLLSDAGIEVKEQMTWEEFEALAKEVYEKTGVPTSFGTYYGPQHQIDISVRNAGLQTYNDEGNGLGFEDVGLITRVFEQYAKSSEDWALKAESYAGITSVEQCPIVTGAAWNEFLFSNQAVALQDAMGADRPVGMVMNPEYSDKTAPGAYLKPSVMIAMGSQGTQEEKDEAAKVVNYILNSTEANDILLGERGAPINSKVRDAIADKVDDATKKTFDYISFIEDKCAPINPPDPAAANEITSNSTRLMNEVIYGQTTPADAAAQFMSMAQELLAG